jgi:hypothetical protein
LKDKRKTAFTNLYTVKNGNIKGARDKIKMDREKIFIN